jgi:CBS domain containing-hemolysin-like protein
MKNILFILILNLFFFETNCKLNEVIADFDSNSNVLIFNGKVFKMTEESYFSSFANDTTPSSQEKEKSKSFFDSFWFNFIGFTVLAIFAGAMSGLTVGYLSIDMLILEIKLNNGTEQEKIYAKKIRKIIADHHWILVTLLVCNAFACEAMPILLDKLVNPMVAIIISVTVLLFVGEIIPQALCTGPKQMKIAAFLAPFTYCLMIITFPISFPIARFMDLVIGKHSKTRFCNNDLKSVIELHLKEANENINSEQINYFTGFLDIINTKIKEMMIPLDKVYKLDYNFNLNHNSLNEMIEKGYSRIPIYENIPNNLKGVLLLKDLIGKDLTHPIALNELNINLLNAIYVNEETFYIDLFEKFKNGKSKMAFVYKEIKKEEKLIPDDLSTAINDNEAKEEKEEKEEKIQVKESMKKDNKNKNKDEEALMPSINDEENNEKIEVEEPLINSINDDENVEKIKVKEPLIPKENKEEKEKEEKEEKNKVEENKNISENNEKIKDEEALIPDGNDEDINENIKIDEAIIPNNKDESKKNKNKKKKEIKEDIIDIEGIKNKNDDDLDNSEKEIIGIITLEDLIESLLKIHFKDEREIIRKPMRKMTL